MFHARAHFLRHGGLPHPNYFKSAQLRGSPKDSCTNLQPCPFHAGPLAHVMDTGRGRTGGTALTSKRPFVGGPRLPGATAHHRNGGEGPKYGAGDFTAGVGTADAKGEGIGGGGCMFVAING